GRGLGLRPRSWTGASAQQRLVACRYPHCPGFPAGSPASGSASGRRERQRRSACQTGPAAGVTVVAMTNGDPPPGPMRRGFRTGRLEAFSDGVFAIAITLLVLDIALPRGAGAHLARSVAGLWPSYLGYVVSFSTIGAIWLGHNAITEYL